ncbi:MAG: ferredoxin [Methanococci archaeon]|nr:ferredoxin [Methanococci archaeon]
MSLEKKIELLKKIREFLILNLEIKKLMKELDVDEEVYNAYDKVVDILRSPNIKLYRMYYDAVKEMFYEEYGKKRKEIEWYPTIDYKKCKNCGKCINFCPRGVYDIENDKVVVRYPFSCIINCNACATMCCENNAIIFPNKKIPVKES